MCWKFPFESLPLDNLKQRHRRHVVSVRLDQPKVAPSVHKPPEGRRLLSRLYFQSRVEICNVDDTLLQAGAFVKPRLAQVLERRSFYRKKLQISKLNA